LVAKVSQEGVVVALGEANSVRVDIKHDITTHVNRITSNIKVSAARSGDLPGGIGIERANRVG